MMLYFFVAVVSAAMKTNSACLDIDYGGWTLVRYVPRGNVFHPATDNLAGKDVYGDPRDMSRAWSVSFNPIRSYGQFLFAMGDCEKWLIADAAVVLGNSWDFAQRSIYKSSLYGYKYSAGWYKRSSNVEDPWISLEDHTKSVRNRGLVYGENNFNYRIDNKPYHNGLSVYIRSKLKQAYLLSKFRRSDKDQDKCLSFLEVAFNAVDRSGDGELTPAEYVSGIADGLLLGTSTGRGTMIDFKRIDRDQDGMLSYDEVAFAVTDTNKNGVISVGELSQAH